jgi:hypothetical protein
MMFLRQRRDKGVWVLISASTSALGNSFLVNLAIIWWHHEHIIKLVAFIYSVPIAERKWNKKKLVTPLPSPKSPTGKVWRRKKINNRCPLSILVIFHLTSPCFSQTRWRWLPVQAKLRQATSLPRMQGSSHDCSIAPPPTPLESLPGSPSAHQGTAVLCYFLGTLKPTSSSRTC